MEDPRNDMQTLWQWYDNATKRHEHDMKRYETNPDHPIAAVP